MINEKLTVLATFYVVTFLIQQIFKNYIPIHEAWQLLSAITLPLIVWIILKKLRDKKNIF